MESMVMKLFRQLVELGVFGKSWVPILSKKYLIRTNLGRLTVSRNDGPGVVGVHGSVNCTYLVALSVMDGIQWGTAENFGEYELEQVLQALVDTYPPEMKDLHVLGFSSMQWPNLPRLLEKLDTLNVREAITALTEKGFFLVNQFPMVTDNKQFAVFSDRTTRMISICKNDGDISQHDVPGLLGGVGGFTRICHLRNGSVTWSNDGYGTKHVEDVLNELLRKFVASQNVDPLGRGLTPEGAQKLHKEQNPHLYPKPYVDPDDLARGIMAGANAGLDGIGYLFLLDEEGNPVNKDGTPLSVNDGEGNLLTGGDAMCYIQEQLQKPNITIGIAPKSTDEKNDEVEALFQKLYPGLWPTQEERSGYLETLKAELPDLVNKDGSYDLLALSSKATLKTGGLARARYVFSLEQQLRASFNDNDKYVAFLERMIKLQTMSPEEFMEDARRSAAELEQMYPVPVDLLNVPRGNPVVSTAQLSVPQIVDALCESSLTVNWDRAIFGDSMKSTSDFLDVAIPSSYMAAALAPYIPHPYEPSPFGPDQQNYVDNPWIVWKREQPDYDEQRDGSPSLLREALIEQLRTEAYRPRVELDRVPHDMLTISGKLSLGYVIHIRYSLGIDWDQAHDFGVKKIEQHYPSGK